MDNKLKVVVDSIIYQLQPKRGISRLFSEILPRMCNMDDSLGLTLLTGGELMQNLPAHPRITHRFIPQVECYLRPGRLWKPFVPSIKRLVSRMLIGRGSGRIWHSTYYTVPEKWDGPIIITVVDVICERFPDLYDEQFREKRRRLVKNADVVICISETTRRDIHHFYELDPASIYVVPLACSNVFRQLERQEERVEMPIGQPFLLYVGDRPLYKNFNGLTKAYSMWKRRKDFDLVVVGKPWLADEEKRLMELGIRDQVHLFANIDDETLCGLYNQAEAFVFPSLYEGFGIPLLEAMSCGCPVIASRIPSTIEVVGDCPIYFEPDEMDDLINAFDVALSEGRNSERIQAGLERVRPYSWDKTAAQTLEVYRAASSWNCAE